MAASEEYRQKAELLIRVLPFVAEEACFALKGGTAINLFVRNMPRFSVDIDLTYLPVADRKTSLAEIDAAMKRIAARIEKGIRGARVTSSIQKGAGIISKHFVEVDGVQIKIEVTPVLRGCVYEPEKRSISEAVEAAFGFAEIQVVNFADLYAGKLVAALDRQHPRDLFDVRDLLANEGMTGALRNAFVVYIISHNRPMAEVLAPTRQDITQEYERGFVGMTEEPVSLDELLKAREDLVAEVVGKMPDEHRRFLASFKRGKPDWELLGIPHIEKLPAVQWKMQNLAAMDPKKREELIGNLLKALGFEE
ncbi:MAG TPA: nucleotidyl transferase AbiEii/AbiGii toxin family protein [Bryobacteraceae bacterium]|nr:nucleotidyl transferase AbiEii/AbiGii toxin family protein [Bryobacteraceae bacterium]